MQVMPITRARTASCSATDASIRGATPAALGRISDRGVAQKGIQARLNAPAASLGRGDLIGGDGPDELQALLEHGAEPRPRLLDPGAMRRPGFGALQNPERVVPGVQAILAHDHRLGRAEPRFDLPDRGPQRVLDARLEACKRIGGDQHPIRSATRGVITEQHPPRRREQARLTSEPPDGIEAGRERHHTVAS